jgi:RNA polymerase sigma-70 factor, ECF subfamily
MAGLRPPVWLSGSEPWVRSVVLESVEMIWEHALPAVSADDAAARELPMDNDAFAAFYERSARPLWAYLTRVSGNHALADDLMQESFVRFLCASAPGDGDVEARRYLFKIATNLLRDHWRRPAPSSIEDLPEGFFASMDASDSLDTRTMLDAALTMMRPRERQLLWLAHAEGYSHQEVAEVMGLGTASVRLLLFRARRKMARLMQEGAA